MDHNNQRLPIRFAGLENELVSEANLLTACYTIPRASPVGTALGATSMCEAPVIVDLQATLKAYAPMLCAVPFLVGPPCSMGWAQCHDFASFCFAMRGCTLGKRKFEFLTFGNHSF